ncbi:MAG TPA: dual specificity protein phosphatase [Thermoanaerobaculia bacterium]|jgi:ADP-ribosyl-[dinitrogen reductase] hydrolase|nr:dual specificity protein phosphatase [Thermoanaerobaculia bacterium]
MNVCCLDEAGCLFLSPRIEDWETIEEHGITVVIDLEGDVDLGIPTMPNHILYVYFPIYDEDLPDMPKLHAVARMAASLVEAGERVLSHCGMGFNRSALLAGLILVYMGAKGSRAVELLRGRRPGALFNQVFADYLGSLPAGGAASRP